MYSAATPDDTEKRLPRLGAKNELASIQYTTCFTSATQDAGPCHACQLAFPVVSGLARITAASCGTVGAKDHHLRVDGEHRRWRIWFD